MQRLRSLPPLWDYRTNSLCGLDLDEHLAYEVPRVVKIKDFRLTALKWLVLLGAMGYVIVYNFLILKAYLKPGTIVGITRLQAKAPAPLYQEPSPAFCSGTTAAPSFRYSVGSGQYTWLGPGSLGPQAQRPCLYLDALSLVPAPLEAGRVFLPTRITVSNQSSSCGAAADQASCTYATVGPSQTYFVPNIEFFTLWLDHSVAAPDLGLSWSNKNMLGKLLDRGGKEVDVCEDYVRLQLPCPAASASGGYISMGKPQFKDIVSVRSLLRAAGIESLDQVGGGNSPQSETHRYAGLALVVSVSYSNYKSSSK